MAGGALQRFWSEVRRRHVPRVAAYYIAGAWVLAQAGSLLLDAFDSAHYTRYVIAALAAGLPVALVLAWIFDVTPRGIERTLALKDPSAPSALPTSPAPEHSILAVLPFANLSDDPANEYFSDGLSEEVRNQLARVDGLRVAARTSAFAFEILGADVREIARRLNVSTILEGGVRKHEDTVRIDVQLVSASDGFQLWSHTFERRLSDIFRLQNEESSGGARGRHGAPRRRVRRTLPTDAEPRGLQLVPAGPASLSQAFARRAAARRGVLRGGDRHRSGLCARAVRRLRRAHAAERALLRQRAGRGGRGEGPARGPARNGARAECWRRRTPRWG